jgi:F-type H+-transporting ATPase subunit a
LSTNISFIQLFSDNYDLIKKYDNLNKKHNIFISYILGNFLLKKNTADFDFSITLNFLKIYSIKKYSNSFINMIINKIFFFIQTLIKENLQTSFYMFFSIYFFSFIVMLTLNLIGLLPYSITATSSFVFILNYSFGVLVGLNILGVYLYSSKYFNQFLPEGVPLFIAPVLVIIELFSNVIRIFSLTVRLFANILAGHSLLKIMIAVS